MDQQEGMSNNKAPLFNGEGYAMWKIRMKKFMLDLGFDIWQSVVDGYIAPTTPPKDSRGKKICNDNSRDVNGILAGLTNSICVKVMHCKSTKEIGTNWRPYMKEMTKSRKPNYRPIELNLKT
jgi:hypothetical protein